MKTKELSVTRCIFLNNIVIGILFLVSTAASLISLAVNVRAVNVVLGLISAVSLFSAVLIMCYVARCKKEETDEMADAELYKAHYDTSYLMDSIAMLILIPVVIYSIMANHGMDRTVPLRTVLSGIEATVFGFVGLKRLFTGILFNRQEKSDVMDD